jgi:hypothetical protein
VEIKRARNLFVRTDAVGDIISVFWPYEQQEGGPNQTGVALSDGEEVHEVAVPHELYSAELPADFFSNYQLRVYERGKAVLARRSTEAGQ